MDYIKMQREIVNRENERLKKVQSSCSFEFA